MGKVLESIPTPGHGSHVTVLEQLGLYWLRPFTLWSYSIATLLL